VTLVNFDTMSEKLFLSKTILIVDDEIDLREIIASEFEYLGAKVYLASNVLVAKEILSQEKIDLVVSDIRMPGGSGIDLLDFVKNQKVLNTSVILISGFADISIDEALGKGVDGYISKPFQLDEIIETALKCIQH
jgi:DNA-binding NtrC family response regulator